MSPLWRHVSLLNEGAVALHIPSWRAHEHEERRQALKSVWPVNAGIVICRRQSHLYGTTNHHKHIWGFLGSMSRGFKHNHNESYRYWRQDCWLGRDPHCGACDCLTLGFVFLYIPPSGATNIVSRQKHAVMLWFTLDDALYLQPVSCYISRDLAMFGTVVKMLVRSDLLVFSSMTDHIAFDRN